MKNYELIEEQLRRMDDESSKLDAEDTDESKQSIEVAAYYLGMERNQYSHPGDETTDWLRAEKAVKENLD
jgi:hypothetical protein